MGRLFAILLAAFFFSAFTSAFAVEEGATIPPGEQIPQQDVKDSKSPGSREEFAQVTKEAIAQWKKKIERVQQIGTPQAQETARFLKTMDLRARADVAELEKVEKKTWLDVKARIELRFRRMDKEFNKIVGG